MQGTHGTGKTGKMTKKIHVRENTGNLEIFAKTQGILFGQVVYSLISKVKDKLRYLPRKFQFKKLNRSAKSVLCM